MQVQQYWINSDNISREHTNARATTTAPLRNAERIRDQSCGRRTLIDAPHCRVLPVPGRLVLPKKPAITWTIPPRKPPAFPP